MPKLKRLWHPLLCFLLVQARVAHFGMLLLRLEDEEFDIRVQAGLAICWLYRGPIMSYHISWPASDDIDSKHIHERKTPKTPKKH